MKPSIHINNTDTLDRSIVIERSFNTTIEKLWNAWTVETKIKQWWGPRGYTCPVAKIDFRTGGNYLFCMQSTTGQRFWSKGTYLEIVPLQKIVATDSFADEQGNTIPAAQLGMPGDWPMELQLTITFTRSEGQTSMRIIHTGLPHEMSDMCEAGWNESFDKLASTL